MTNLALDPVTGSDPEGIKLRSAEGFNAADYFVGNDWFTANYWYVQFIGVRHPLRSLLCYNTTFVNSKPRRHFIANLSSSLRLITLSSGCGQKF